RTAQRGRAGRADTPPFRVEELTPELWPEFEKLFGANGACAGCWCMWWRVRKGERFMQIHGAEAKRRQKALVLAGKSHGLIAFAGDEPVGWCAYGQRTEFSALGRSRTLACDDAERVWALPCFFIKSGWRGRGVARTLLRAAIDSLRRQGARVIEAYPVRPPASNATAFTGTVPWFESEGFRVLTNRPRGRQRARLEL